MDSIPTEGDRAYRKRRTLRVEGFDNEEYYAIVSNPLPPLLDREH